MKIHFPDGEKLRSADTGRVVSLLAGGEPVSQPAADLCYSKPVVDDVWSGLSKSALIFTLPTHFTAVFLDLFQIRSTLDVA